jgi:mannose-6-phosphate isomerase-like protein (cupin superfamily)
VTGGERRGANVKTAYQHITPYITRDGSEIRELMHPDVHGNRNQSFAEAIVAPGCTTYLHQHAKTEEIYHITAGEGSMRLGEDVFAVRVGDTICIPPRTPHCIANSGCAPLRILCACSPAYAHEDTELL